MTTISIEALKKMTVGEILELIKQANNLQENHSRQRTHLAPSGDLGSADTSNFAEKLVEDLI